MFYLRVGVKALSLGYTVGVDAVTCEPRALTAGDRNFWTVTAHLQQNAW